MNKQFIMLSGLPRSGSTVLSSILNQNPNLTVTSTSPLADVIINAYNTWSHVSSAMLHPDIKQLHNIILGIINNSYVHIDQLVIDKNRLWPRLSDLMFQITHQRSKIICTVRDIPDILTSYVLLINQPNNNFVNEDLTELNLPITLKNQCKILWEKYILYPYTSLRIGLSSKHADFLIVDYNQIIDNPQKIVDDICEFISIESYTVQTTGLMPMLENDSYHGIKGLHNVRTELKKTSPMPETILGTEITHLYKSMKLEFWKTV